MGMAAILYNCAELYEQIGNNLLTEGPMGNLVKISQTISEKTLNWRADNHLGTKFWL